tara:strand:+ start:1581 stop:3089 length:1509 start_codon:yes stop_codon:yes gene_type:complete
MTRHIKAFFLVFILFSISSNTVSSNENNLKLEKVPENFSKIKDSQEFKEILEGIKKREPLKQNKGVDWKEFFQNAKPFIILGILFIFFIVKMSEDTEKPKKVRKISKAKDFINTHNALYDQENKNFEVKTKKNTDLKIHIQSDTLDDQKYISVYGIGPVTIQLKKLELDSFKAKMSVYVSDVTDKPIFLKCTNKNYSDQNSLLSSSYDLDIPAGAEYYEYTKITSFPKNLVIPAKKGKRKLQFNVYFTNLDMIFENGVPKEDKKNKVYINKSVEKQLDYKEPGFLETKQYNEIVLKNSANLAIHLASLENKINQAEINIIKYWLRDKYSWGLFDYFDLDESEDVKIKKAELSFFLSQSCLKAENKKIDFSNIISDLNEKANLNQKYEIINLLLNVASSDDKLGLKEDKFVNEIAQGLNLDLNYFQQIKNIAIANVSNIEQSENLDISVFNLTENMTKEQKCLKLRQEYSKWNRQTNNNNENIRNRAKKMVKYAAEMRKKYGC